MIAAAFFMVAGAVALGVFAALSAMRTIDWLRTRAQERVMRATVGAAIEKALAEAHANHVAQQGAITGGAQ